MTSVTIIVTSLIKKSYKNNINKMHLITMKKRAFDRVLVPREEL